MPPPGLSLGMAPHAHRPEVTRFVHALIITGAWLDEVNRGLALELRPEDYPGELLLDVVFGMLCGTIATATESIDASELDRATEIIELAAAQVEGHLRVVHGVWDDRSENGDGDPRSDA
jgi:hypothetical protein